MRGKQTGKKLLAIQNQFCYLCSANDSTPFFALLMVQMLARPVPWSDLLYQVVLVLGHHSATRSVRLLRGNKFGALGGRQCRTINKSHSGGVVPWNKAL
jgi:hypothetical protein